VVFDGSVTTGYDGKIIKVNEPNLSAKTEIVSPQVGITDHHGPGKGSSLSRRNGLDRKISQEDLDNRKLEKSFRDPKVSLVQAYGEDIENVFEEQEYIRQRALESDLSEVKRSKLLKEMEKEKMKSLKSMKTMRGTSKDRDHDASLERSPQPVD
jgi:hypothetical protein